jgi:hypothetical protein
MPARSTAQRRFFAIAEHHPEQLRDKMPNMTRSQMHDFASTKEKGLPHYATQHPHRNLKGFLHAPKSSLGSRMRGMRTAGAFKPPVPRGTY